VRTALSIAKISSGIPQGSFSRVNTAKDFPFSDESSGPPVNLIAF